jgi:hypothetical protein
VSTDQAVTALEEQAKPMLDSLVKLQQANEVRPPCGRYAGDDVWRAIKALSTAMVAMVPTRADDVQNNTTEINLIISILFQKLNLLLDVVNS